MARAASRALKKQKTKKYRNTTENINKAPDAEIQGIHTFSMGAGFFRTRATLNSAPTPVFVRPGLYEYKYFLSIFRSAPCVSPTVA